MRSSSAAKALVLTPASSAGIHGGLVPAHAAEPPVLATQRLLRSRLVLSSAGR
jgi:hypothetical protein